MLCVITLIHNIVEYLFKSWRRVQATSPRQQSACRLPVEIIERCADYLFETGPPVAGISICRTKPAWAEVCGWMATSPELNRMGRARWLAVLTIYRSDEWNQAVRYSHLVRELRCKDGAFDNIRNRRVLADFGRLHTLSIDAHSDAVHDEHNRFSYRDLFLSLPPSLRRLEVLRSHGPDINIINTVKTSCLHLEELRLGRCTLFNSSTMCNFWKTFPLEHDSYMSIEDTDSYANSLARELSPLQSLQTLALGLYLIPSSTILAHRLYHKRGMVAPQVIEWQNAIPIAGLPNNLLLDDAPLAQILPATTDQLISVLHQADPPEEFGRQVVCSLCVDSVAQIGNDAEMRASGILKGQLLNLASIQWMSWLSPDHLGVNEHEL